MDTQLFEEDLKVLSRLRGYAEDLRRYSNLIKQAHPRGVSALKHVLDRPAATGRPDFPAPVFAVADRRIWRRADLVAYRTAQKVGEA